MEQDIFYYGDTNRKMSNRQKLILNFLSLILVGILTIFALFILHNPATNTSSAIANPACGTPGENGENCDLEIKNDFPESTLTPETLITIVPSVDIEPIIPPTLSIIDAEPSSSNNALATPLPCPVNVTGGLVTEMQAIIEAMPLVGSNGFVPPTDAHIAGWELLVQAVVNYDLLAACSIIQTYGFPYELVQFTDDFFEDQRYVMLRETIPIQAGWGTYVFRTNPDATPLVVEILIPRQIGILKSRVWRSFGK